MPSTPTEAVLDVNVIIASIFADHVMHARARQFVEALARFHTTPTTQGGFLRFATRPWKNERKEKQPPRLTMAEAHANSRSSPTDAGTCSCLMTCHSRNFRYARCKDIGSGPTLTCCTWLASTGLFWLRLKVE
jgi:hypothetical protein